VVEPDTAHNRDIRQPIAAALLRRWMICVRALAVFYAFDRLGLF
jgi:hypothetical protein